MKLLAFVLVLVMLVPLKCEKYLDLYKLVHEYTFTHFKDEVYGEWYGYLRRDGSISTDLKGNIFKGPFHIPRCELENILQIKKILEK